MLAWIVVAAAVALTAASAIFSTTRTMSDEESVALEGRRELRVDVDYGDVVIRSGADDVARAVRHARYSAVAPLIVERFDDGALTISSHTRPRRFGHQRVDFDLHVPAGSHLVVSCPSGHVAVLDPDLTVDVTRELSGRPATAEP